MQCSSETEDLIAVLQAENSRLRQQCADLQQAMDNLRASETHYRTMVTSLSLQHTEEALRVQSELTIALSAINDLDIGLKLVLDTVLQLDAIDCGGVYLHDPQNGVFDLATHQGLSPGFIASSCHIEPDSPQAALVRAGIPVYQDYSSLAFVPEERRGEGLHAVAIIPIPHDGTMIACLNLASHSHDTIPFQTRVTLEAIAAQIGSTIVRIAAETALHESQRNFQSLFDCLQDLLFVLNTDGTVCYANPAVEQTLGYSSTDLYGMSVLDLHPADRHDEAAAVFAALVSGETELCTIPVQTSDGRSIPVETRVTAGVWNGQTVLFGIARDMTEQVKAKEALCQSQEQLEQLVQERTAQLFAAIEDLHAEISQRQQVEKSLRRSEARYREIADLISDSIYSVRYYADGSIRLEWGFNGIEQLSGYTAEEITIHNWQQIVHPDDRTLVAQQFERLLGGSASDVEYRLLTKQGDIRWMHDRARPIWSETENRVVRLYGAVSDITERKQAEEALHSNLRFLETLLDTIPSPVFAKDTGGRYIACNQRFASDILGLEKAEIIERTIFELPQVVSSSHASIYHSRDQQLLQHPGHQMYEANVRYADGSMHDVFFFKATFEDSTGTVAGIVGILHDITDYNLTKKALIQAENFKQSVLDSLTDHIAVLDESGTIVAVNQAWRAFAEANPPLNGNIAEGVNYYQVCESAAGEAATEAAEVVAGIRAIFAGTRETFTLEYPCHSPDEQRWFVCHITRFVDSAPRYVVVAHQNITGRKQAENALRESETLFRSLFDHLPVGVALGHPDYTFAGVNAAFCRFIGYTEQELLSLSFADISHPEDLPAEIVLARQLTAGTADQYSMDKRYLRKGGRIVWGHLSVRLVWKADGRSHYGLGVVEDITERKEMEEALRESEARQRMLLSALPDMVFRIDQDGVFVDFKTPRDEYLLMPPEQFLGRNYRELLPMPISEQLRAAIAQARQSGQVERFEYQIPRAGGKWEDEDSNTPGQYHRMIADCDKVSIAQSPSIRYGQRE